MSDWGFGYELIFTQPRELIEPVFLQQLFAGGLASSLGGGIQAGKLPPPSLITAATWGG